MKKIPTLFERQYDENGRVIGILQKVKPGFEWVPEGEGVATVKIDGACCAIIEGMLYKRYDAKHGKPVPEGAIKCQDAPDPVTGHWPCWVRCDRGNPADKWFWAAFEALEARWDGTYEAMGPHFNGNTYQYARDMLIPHGIFQTEMERSFEGIQKWLESHEEEGLVFWKDGEPKCKIKRSDFGLPWGNANKKRP